MRCFKYLTDLFAAGVLFCLALIPGPVWAAKFFSVSLDTSPLSSLLGPYYIEFQFNDGDGVNNNSVVLSSFDFGPSGGPTGVANLIGGASGGLEDKLILTDLEFINEFIQEFVPGSLLTFVVSISENSLGSVPDQFSFAILDGDLFELPTSGPGSEFLSIDLAGPLVVAAYDGLDVPGTPFIGAPKVSFIPEPSPFVLLPICLGLVLLVSARRTKHGECAQ